MTEKLHNGIFFTELNIGSQITIQERLFEVVGIDTYTVINMMDTRKSWQSFTMVGQERVSVTVGITDTPILWTAGNKIAESELEEQYDFVPEYSGQAEIQFEGDRGISQPSARGMMYRRKDDPTSFFAIETFLDAKGESINYFQGRSLV